MNSKIFLAFAIIACVATNFCMADSEAAAEDNAYSETAAISNLDIDPAKAITAYDYRAMMLRSIGKVFQCWRCSSPCSAYACCNDGYPQCCLVNGRCMCCRI